MFSGFSVRHTSGGGCSRGFLYSHRPCLDSLRKPWASFRLTSLYSFMGSTRMELLVTSSVSRLVSSQISSGRDWRSLSSKMRVRSSVRLRISGGRRRILFLAMLISFTFSRSPIVGGTRSKLLLLRRRTFRLRRRPMSSGSVISRL